MMMLRKILRKIKKLLIRYSTNPRPSSYPFISGDTVRKIADHVQDERRSIKPKNVKEKDVVFVQTDMIDDFLENIHPQIESRYILISHNADDSINSIHIKYLDEKIIHWFAQNLLVEHPKITPLPIGLENAHWCNHGELKLIKEKTKDEITKQTKILSGFNIRTNEKERTEANNALRKNPLTEKIEKRLGTEKYFDNLKKYQFVASPPGNGEDCIRTWEALYFKTVPIVKRSVLTEYFKDKDLPLLLIDSWDDVIDFDEVFLNNFYKENEHKFNSKILKMDYWIEKINDYKK